jgi:hypothetical protein
MAHWRHGWPVQGPRFTNGQGSRAASVGFANASAVAITINQQVFCEPRYKLTAYLHCKGCVILLWQYPLIFPINSIVSLSFPLLELVLGFNSLEERQAFDLAPDVGVSLESPHVRLCMNNVDCPTYSPGFRV